MASLLCSSDRLLRALEPQGPMSHNGSARRFCRCMYASRQCCIVAQESHRMPGKQPTEILVNIAAVLPELEAAYKDIHAHPELSMQETRTAGLAASHLKANGFEVT